jgi:hypothetical protein
MPIPTLEAPGDILRRMLDDTIRAWDPVWQSWSEAMPTWPAPAQAGERGGHRDCHGCGQEHSHDHGRRHAPCARGACDCCVGDADLVVVTRLGESRIVPLVIGNEWRRERTVEVEVGEFAPSCHEDALVRVAATVRPGGAITIAPCGRVEVGIQLRTAPPAKVDALDSAVRPAPVSKRAAAAKVPASKAATSRTAEVNARAEAIAVPAGAGSIDKEFPDRQGPLPDVGCCTTMYAEVRVSDCGRPLRLAVVVLPLACDAYEVDCQCGCC